MDVGNLFLLCPILLFLLLMYSHFCVMMMHVDLIDRCRLKRLKTLILPGNLSLKDDLKIKAKVSSDACFAWLSA